MDGPLKIALRNKTNKLSNCCGLYEMIYIHFRSGKFTDVTLTSSVDGKEFKCHRLVLAAASEYFDAMFRGNWREQHERRIKFPDVEGATLELFLQFAYQGMIILDDKNVYAALRLSDRFGVSTLEHLCVRYLIERNIPMNCAIELFAFACAANKASLIPPLRDFILNHYRKLSKVAGENALLRLNLDELKTLLANRQPQSREREEEFWKALVHWVSENYPKQRSMLQELIPIFKCDLFNPPRDFIRWFIKEEDYVCDNVASCPVVNTSEALLHMYVTSKDKKTCYIVTMDADFHHQPVQVALGKKCIIKTVTMGNQLYLYALRIKRNYQDLTFSVYSSVRLTDKQMLMNPANELKCSFLGNVAFNRQAFNAANIFSDPIYKRIYLRHNFEPWTQGELFAYECGCDRWSPINYRGKEVGVAAATFFDHRLFSFRCSKIVEAYDPRAGTWEKLRSSSFVHCDTDKFCSHKGKLYATCEWERVIQYGCCYVKSEVYDPVAGKWREVSPTSFPQDEIPHAGWLVSLENKLWIFRETHYSSVFPDHYNYRFQRFDSFLEKWGSCRRLFQNRRDVNLIKDIVVSRL